MGILHAEALEHGLVPVRPPIVVGVAVEADLRAVLHERAVAPGEHAQRNGEPVGKHAGRGRLPAKRFVDHEHLVAATGGEEIPRGIWAFVGVERIFDGRRGPEPAPGVERQRHELAIGIARRLALGEHEFGREPFGKREPLRLLRGREGPGLQGVGPLRRLRRGRKRMDGDIFDLHERLAAAVHLNPDVAIGRNRGVGLAVFDRWHAVDPRANLLPFGPNLVFVPVVRLDRRFERLRVDGAGKHLVAAGLIVELAPPARARIDLIALHLARFRHAKAANLDT